VPSLRAVVAGRAWSISSNIQRFGSVKVGKLAFGSSDVCAECATECRRGSAVSAQYRQTASQFALGFELLASTVKYESSLHLSRFADTRSCFSMIVPAHMRI
jgi:hypothetical protein